MNPYQEKLKAFNDTEKYKLESFFVRQIIGAKPDEKILDFGCGLGRMVWQHRLAEVDCYGYDINNFRENDNPVIFREQYHFKFRQIYFMHSFAHLPKPEALFSTAFDTLLEDDGRIVIFTPNRDWLYYKNDPAYIPDNTVVRHYNLLDLRKLFESYGYEVEQEGQFGEQAVGACERIFFVARKKR